jgi:hypothetical protein
VQITIQWSQEDIERKLRDELAESGFKVVTEKTPGGEDKSGFNWTVKPVVTVMVKAEPDPAAKNEPIVFKETLPVEVMHDLRKDTRPEMPPLDLTMFPPGANLTALAAVEKAARQEEALERHRKRHIPGESNERPE